MANHLRMALVETILTLCQRGWSQRRIAEELGINRETVSRQLKSRAADSSKPAIAPTGSEEASESSKPATAPHPAPRRLSTVQNQPPRPSARTKPLKVQNQPARPPAPIKVAADNQPRASPGEPSSRPCSSKALPPNASTRI